MTSLNRLLDCPSEEVFLRVLLKSTSFELLAQVLIVRVQGLDERPHVGQGSADVSREVEELLHYLVTEDCRELALVPTRVVG